MPRVQCHDCCVTSAASRLQWHDCSGTIAVARLQRWHDCSGTIAVVARLQWHNSSGNGSGTIAVARLQRHHCSGTIADICSRHDLATNPLLRIQCYESVDRCEIIAARSCYDMVLRDPATRVLLRAHCCSGSPQPSGDPGEREKGIGVYARAKRKYV